MGLRGREKTCISIEGLDYENVINLKTELQKSKIESSITVGAVKIFLSEIEAPTLTQAILDSNLGEEISMIHSHKYDSKYTKMSNGMRAILRESSEKVKEYLDNTFMENI